MLSKQQMGCGSSSEYRKWFSAWIWTRNVEVIKDALTKISTGLFSAVVNYRCSSLNQAAIPITHEVSKLRQTGGFDEVALPRLQCEIDSVVCRCGSVGDCRLLWRIHSV